MFKLIEIIESEQIAKRVISIYDKFNQTYKVRYLGRTYIVLDFLFKTPENKEKSFFYEEEVVKKITEYKEVFYFDDNLEDIIKNFKIHEYKKQFFNLMLEAFLETDKIKENTKNKLKLYFNLE
jgi:putative TPR-repeat-containing protein